MKEKEKDELKDKASEAEETAEETTPESADEPGIDEELKATREMLADTKEQLLRLAAEYDNFKKRTQREKDELFVKSKVYVITELLPTIDNFERAQENAADNFEDYKKGVEMIFSQLDGAIGKLGVEAFGAEGDAFDPNIHNAVMHKEDETLGENVVSRVFQKGYRIGDTILRHAMVETAN